MKILVLTNLFPPHHAGTFDFRCQTVTDALRKRGHFTRVLTSNHGVMTEQRDPEIERRLLLNGVYGHPWVTGYRAMKALESHNYAALRETLADQQPDLVFVWSLHGLSKSLIAALVNSRMPTVYAVADDWLALELREDPWLRWWNRDRSPLLSGLWRGTLELLGQRSSVDRRAPTRVVTGPDRLPEVFGNPERLARVEPDSVDAFRLLRLFFSSEALKQKSQLAGFRVSHAEVIPPGIPAESFVAEPKPISAPTRKFLVVADLEPASGVMTVLKALLQARDNQVQASVTVYGRGQSDYIAQLRSFAVQHQLPVEFVTLSNLAQDLPAVYRRHDALLYTPEWEEPFAVTPLEAMASGLPVIGAAIGGGRELFRHGENALTFRAGDVMGLASRIQELQMQPALRRQMAENAQAEVLARFNETTVTDQIESYLQSSLTIWQQI